MAPHIAALYSLLIKKARIPRSYKKAELTPILFQTDRSERHTVQTVCQSVAL